MTRWILISMGCLLSLAMVGCRNSSKVVAMVDGNSITIERLKKEIAKRHSSFTTNEQKEALLKDMIQTEVLHLAAKEAGYNKDPEIIARQKQMIANRFRQDNLGPRLEKVAITDGEVERYYQEHKADFTRPKMVRPAIIQVAIPKGASEEKKAQLAKKAEAARVEALRLDLATASLAEVAVKYSDDQTTRYRGGDVGWVQMGEGKYRWEDEVVKAIFRLSRPGELSPIITTQNGFYLLKLMEAMESAPQPLAQVKDHINYKLMSQKRQQVEREFYEELKRKFSVRINNDLLSSLALSEESKKSKPMPPPALPGK